MSKYKTRPIGEIFEYCKLKLQVVENETCEGCFFCYEDGCQNSTKSTGYCGRAMRNDDKYVIFKHIGEY